MKNIKVGILGGGQLGLLLAQAGIQFPIFISIYDPDPECPAAAHTQNFVQGKFDDYEAILKFGMEHEIILFETEQVNVDALLELQKRGKKVASSPQTLEWIQDKGRQKQVLKEAGLPVPHFEDAPADKIREYDGPFPIVQKWRTGGYDGYGVQIHLDKASIQKAPEVDSILEEKIDIDKEIGVLVARNEAGEIAVYPPVEMVFDPEANLVDYLIAPARIEENLERVMKALAEKMAEKMEFIGIYAIEFFIDRNGKIFVNEISPRPHNSGHHTISANVTSQYEQQLRIVLGLPLGSAQQISPCVLVNLLADQSTGDTHYVGLEEAYRIPNVQYTFYGKQTVRPSRKMGHALILEKTLEKAVERMNDIRSTLTITSHE